jgi:hypothetical protein
MTMSTAIEAWQQGKQYDPSVVVTHNGKTYQKLDDGDQSEPDEIGGGWSLITASNVTEFNAIAQSFDTYEQRVIEHQQKLAKAKETALQKLSALGLSQLEVEALFQ